MAAYRKMRKYAKSVVQWKKQRFRRKKILEMFDRGFTQKRMAHELGISTKTVQRDFKKLRSYLRGCETRQRLKMVREMDEALDKYPPSERFHVVSQLLMVSDDPRLFFEALGCLLRGEKFRVAKRED